MPLEDHSLEDVTHCVVEFRGSKQQGWPSKSKRLHSCRNTPLTELGSGAVQGDVDAEGVCGTHPNGRHDSTGERHQVAFEDIQIVCLSPPVPFPMDVEVTVRFFLKGFSTTKRQPPAARVPLSLRDAFARKKSPTVLDMLHVPSHIPTRPSNGKQSGRNPERHVKLESESGLEALRHASNAMAKKRRLSLYLEGRGGNVSQSGVCFVGAQLFSFYVPVIVTSISPTTGPLHGGDLLRVNGTFPCSSGCEVFYILP